MNHNLNQSANPSATSIPSDPLNSLHERINEIKTKTFQPPTALIATRQAFEQLRQSIAAQKHQFNSGAIPSLATQLYGIPIEQYPTVKECMDRMMAPRDGERLQLILSESIPIDCLNHPWVQQQAKAAIEHLGGFEDSTMIDKSIG